MIFFRISDAILFMTNIRREVRVFKDIFLHNMDHKSSRYGILYMSAIFKLSIMIRIASRTCHPQSHTWRTLIVPYWSLEGWGHDI